MSLATVLSLIGLVLMMLVNIGGWVWFFATLKAQVTALNAQQTAFAAQLALIPKDFMPREQILQLFSARDAMDNLRTKQLEEISADVKKLLENWNRASEPPHRPSLK